MYLNLFQLASLAIIGWIPLIFLPTWRATRRLADSAFFPIYIAVLYAFGVVALVAQFGPGFISDFGSANGVTRLLARPEIALVAWLHILTFDQVIGITIYRENMRRRYVPMPVQSALLFLTLMFGPLGYLTFVVIRVARRGTGAFGSDEDVRAQDVSTGAPRSDAAPTLREIVAAYRQERVLTAVALFGIALGVFTLLAIAIRGALVAPEGDLTKPASFDVAVGMYLLSLIPWLPVSGFSPAARARWRHWATGLLLYAFSIETIQQFRGIDPRFSRAEPVSQIFGGFFFAAALGIVTLSVALGARSFETRADGRRGLLVLAARWTAVSTMIGFLAGMWMSAIQGRAVAPEGSVLPLHAAGFHALQAIPLVALLFAWSSASVDIGRRWVHVAGAAWAAACVAIWWQTALGRAVTSFDAAGAVTIVLLALWAIAGLRALVAWRSPANRVEMNWRV
jgi:hypothetical protein